MKVSLIGVVCYCLLSYSAEAFSPDTLLKTVERRSLPTHDEEITFYDKKKRFATLKVFNKWGILLTETNFKDYLAGIRQGFAKGFYPDGQLYWISDYRNNELWGDFRVYYEDGTLKRREVHRSGIRKEKYCYNRNGEEVPFYEFSEGPMFRGGDYAFQTYLRTKLKDVHVGSQAEMFTFDVLIQADSVAVLQRFMKSSLVTMDKLTDIIKDMPRWIPAHFDDMPHEQAYTVNLVFRAGTVYLSNLALDFAGAYRKQIQPFATPVMPPLQVLRRR
ncbi:MAG: hypothetical protein U0X91_21630 [Spirosomataceae bacterium]